MIYENLITNVSDIKDKRGQKIIVDIDIYNDNECIESYSLELDLKQMGISKNTDYEFQLAKDIDREITKYYYSNKELPPADIIQNIMNGKRYISISLPKENIKIPKEKIEQFNELCGDWDYRNIDMTDSHISGIDILMNKFISISCERFDTTLDDYISCSGGTIGSKNLIEKFNKLELDIYEDVLDFMSSLNQCVSWDKVDSLLDKELEKELSKLSKDDLEEIEMEREDYL